MAQIYAWSPAGIPQDEAERRFADVLERRRATYATAYGGTIEVQRRRVGSMFVGVVAGDLGVRGWSPWVLGAGVGLAWAGICEDFLGVDWEPPRVAETVSTLLDQPEDGAEWAGSFAAVAWDEPTERVAVVTGGAQSQTLWRTEGRDGWACGSRARPLLDLVGTAPEIDPVQASLFVSFGYLAGTGSLFRSVERVPSRRHVAMGAGGDAIVREYMSAADFLHAGKWAEIPLRESVERVADRYAARVAGQHRFSLAPVLSLTGGRDSRSIAAALAHTQFTGPARTGGVPESDDVILAAEVARALGFAHERVSSDVGLVERLHGAIDHAIAWSWSSEGIETIRHALHYEWFFEDRGSHAAGPSEQNFNGLRPFLNRRHAPGWQREDLRATVRDDLHHQRDALAHFDAMAERLDRDVSAAGGNANHFADLHFWQVKVLHSGQDNILVKDLFSLWWTPLVDATVIRANWHLPTDRLPRAAFIESLTRALAPELGEIRYAGAYPSRVQTLLKRIRRKLPRPFRPAPKPSFAVSPDRTLLWREILLEREALVWKDLIDPAVVRRTLDADRGDHLLWSLATIELFAQAHLAGVQTPMPSDGSRSALLGKVGS